MEQDDGHISIELQELYTSFQKCLDLRDKYIRLSLQRLEDNPREYDGAFSPAPDTTSTSTSVLDLTPIDSNGLPPPTTPKFEKWNIYPPPLPPHWNHDDRNTQRLGSVSPAPRPEFFFEECHIPKGHPYVFQRDEQGVYQVYNSADARTYLWIFGLWTSIILSNSRSVCWRSKRIYDSHHQGVLLRFRVGIIFLSFMPNPSLHSRSVLKFFFCKSYILSVISDGPAKSFAWRRLKYLESRWNVYTLLNEYQELADMKVIGSGHFSDTRLMNRPQI